MHSIQKHFQQLVGIPVPAELKRQQDAWQGDELAQQNVCLLSHSSSHISELLKQELADAGMQMVSATDLDSKDEQRVHSLVLDLSALSDLHDLDRLYTALHKYSSHLEVSGRVVLIADPLANTAEQQVILPALEGFMRSLSKELGRYGATVNLIHLQLGNEQRLMPTLRFLLSDRSAFICAQTFHVTQNNKDKSPACYQQPLAGKQIIITGAARGIGLALAETMAREGGKVIGIDMPGNTDLKREMTRLGGLAFELDVCQADAANKLCSFLKSDVGTVDIVVHNAGITRDKTLKRLPAKDWDLVLAINLHAPIALTRALLDNKLINKNGRIIGMASISGIAGNPGQTNYALTKGGLAGFMAGLAVELKSKGITANTIAPGFIETEMTNQIPLAVRTIGRQFNALKQGGLPQDVAELATFLASPNSSGISGANIRVCGHNLLGR